MERTEIKKEIIDYSSFQLIKDIIVLIKPYRFRFWAATFLRLVRDLASLYPAFAFASIVSFIAKYKAGESFEQIYVVIFLWGLAMILRIWCNYLCKIVGFAVGEKIKIDSNLMAVKHMFQLDMAWHEKENSGNKLKRIQNAGSAFDQINRIWFGYIISVIVNLVFINIIIAQIDTTVLYMLLGFCVVYFFVSGTMKRKAGNASREVNIEEEKFNGLLFEGMNNMRTVKVMSMSQILETHLLKNTKELFRKTKTRIFWFQSRYSILMAVTSIAKIGITIFIIQGIFKGHYELGFLVLFNSYFNDLTTAIEELANSSVDFTIHKLSIARMKSILNEPINIDKEEGKIPFPSDWQKIIFQDVSFSYEDNKVLDRLSFEIKKGEKVGIVGSSGAGKSTLFKLLLKEREEFEGGISFDDVSIKNISKKSYFKKVSVVLQDTEVFNFSLKENITITNAEEQDNQKLLEQSLETARIKEVVDKLPSGLETLIGEKGVKLSGGERQRLGLARAVFKQPEILLLDEATSHLDLESEEKIRDSLHSFFENITAIVIAHRLTTIKQMDKILVLEEGKILEEGNFNDLYAKKGRFYELWEKQKI